MTIDALYVILNPTADRGRAAATVPAVRRVLDRAGIRWEMAPTEAAGHATILAVEAMEQGWPALAVVGGDGTVNEAVNGLLRVSGEDRVPPLGIIPAGGGNDFVKLLGVPRADAAAAARYLLDGRIRRVDVGRVDDRYFINGVGWGFDGMVALEAQKIRSLHGFPLYFVALLRVLTRYRSAPVTLTIDGRSIDETAIMVAMTNGACHGGGFWICPHARIDDGRIDVCVGRAMPPLPLLRLVFQVTRGAHLENPRVWFETGKVVELQSSVSMPVHMDGEILSTGRNEVRVEVLPRRLKVLA